MGPPKHVASVPARAGALTEAFESHGQELAEILVVAAFCGGSGQSCEALARACRGGYSHRRCPLGSRGCGRVHRRSPSRDGAQGFRDGVHVKYWETTCRWKK